MSTLIERLKAAQKLPTPEAVREAAAKATGLSRFLAKQKAKKPALLQIVKSVRRDTDEEPASETIRIVRLPLIDYFDEGDLTDEFRKPGAPRVWVDHRGTTIRGLRSVQSAALAAIRQCRGGFFPIGVGHGKAGIALLAATALDCDVAIVFTTSGTVTQLRTTYAEWRRFYRICPRTYIISYDQLSKASASGMLEEMVRGVPDHKIAVICDEAHKIKDPDAARTKRIIRFFCGEEREDGTTSKGHENACFVALSGTMTAKSLKDFSHLAEMALRHLSPVPRDNHHLDAWAECIDDEGKPGSLDWPKVRPLWDEFAPEGSPDMDSTKGETKRSIIRRAFQARLRSNPGVVATTDASVNCSLTLHGLTIDVPETIKEAMRRATEEGETPDGEPLPDDVSEWRLLRQLSCGFYLVWQWPNGEEDLEWLQARRNWNRHVRRELQTRATEGYDSPLLVSNRIQDDIRRGRPQDMIHEAWVRWNGQRHKRWLHPDGTEQPVPPTRTIWVDRFFIDAVLTWLKKQREPVLVWYQSIAVRDALADSGRIHVVPAGVDPPTKVMHCAISFLSHRDGLNLQAWARNLYLEPSSSGEAWEQSLGRTHRQGQTADEVESFVYQHTDIFKKALKTARRKARYIEDTFGNVQKLNIATMTGLEEDLGAEEEGIESDE